MRPTEVVRRAAGYLARREIESPTATAERLLMSVLGTDRTGIYLSTRDLSTTEARRFGRALCRRCTGTPVQHLTGDQGFRRLRLSVRPGVFVPRPETEVLVDAALRLVVGTPSPVVVDVGTGTGAVALAIKDERPDARVLATDVSSRAVALAAENADRLDLEVELFEGDLLRPLPDVLRGSIDVVVSNPPYIAPGEHGALPKEVRADPPLSLLGGLDVYARLFEQSARWVRGRGGVAIEIDERRAGDVVALAGTTGFHVVEVAPDLAGRDRVVTARRVR